jgi:hypothetical protein
MPPNNATQKKKNANNARIKALANAAAAKAATKKAANNAKKANKGAKKPSGSSGAAAYSAAAAKKNTTSSSAAAPLSIAEQIAQARSAGNVRKALQLENLAKGIKETAKGASKTKGKMSAANAAQQGYAKALNANFEAAASKK